MLLFVNYAHFSKKCWTYAITFYFKFGKNTSITMQQTSKWQTHLPYLHLATLKMYNLLADDYKNTNT